MDEINDEVDTQEIVEAVPKRKPGTPAGSKNKKQTEVDPPVVTPEPEVSAPPKAPVKRAKRPRSPSSESDSPAPKIRSKRPKRKSRTRVIVLSSSESEEARPPPVRVVRKPRTVPAPPSSSEDELPPSRTVAPRVTVRLELNLQGRQNFVDSRHATYSALFRHLS